jgi:hypothetical protein
VENASLFPAVRPDKSCFQILRSVQGAVWLPAEEDKDRRRQVTMEIIGVPRFQVYTGARL